MSHVFDALKQAETERSGRSLDVSELGDFATRLLRDEMKQQKVDRNWMDDVQVVNVAAREEHRMVTLTDPDCLGAQKFRLLRARLRHLREKSPLKRIVVTGGVPDDGKTVVSSNLAMSLAHHNSQRVLLLEGDLRQPAASAQFGLQGLRGLNEWSLEDKPIGEFIYRLGASQLFLLPAGEPAEDPLKILNSSRFAATLDRISVFFDWIIIDTPPLFPVADVHSWVNYSDGVLLVVRQGHTPKKLLQKGLRNLDGVNLLGVVMNDAPAAEHTYYRKYYNQSVNRAHSEK
ncbi:MAG TPA: CpsD/CapB family tyrosine-protein kinase [Candidatus Sulfotelmatobacter sp.]|jgi:capsular exopolysaccharide synthesis family protein